MATHAVLRVLVLLALCRDVEAEPYYRPTTSIAAYSLDGGGMVEATLCGTRSDKRLTGYLCVGYAGGRQAARIVAIDALELGAKLQLTPWASLRAGAAFSVFHGAIDGVPCIFANSATRDAKDDEVGERGCRRVLPLGGYVGVSLHLEWKRVVGMLAVRSSAELSSSDIADAVAPSGAAFGGSVGIAW